MFGTISPCLTIADDIDPTPTPEPIIEAIDNVDEAQLVEGGGEEETENEIHIISGFDVEFDKETGVQLPLFELTVENDVAYEDIDFPKSVKGKIDNGEEWEAIPVIQWIEKETSRTMPEGYVCYVPVFDGDSYSIKDGIAIPYGTIEFKAIETAEKEKEAENIDIQDAQQESVIEENAEEPSNNLETVAESTHEIIHENVSENDSNEIINNNDEISEELTVADSEEEILTDDEPDKKKIRGFYFYEENGTYESPVKGAENVLFYLRLPANISLEKFLLPNYVDAYVDDDNSPQRVKILQWKKRIMMS